MKLGNTVQRYFNFMTEMELKKNGFAISKLMTQFKITHSAAKILKDLKYIEQIPNPDGKSMPHWYAWITKKPTMDMAEEVVFYVNDAVKAYNKGNIPAPVVRKKKKVETAVVKEIKPLTDEMCIEHLRKSTEFKYEIFRYTKEKLL